MKYEKLTCLSVVEEASCRVLELPARPRDSVCSYRQGHPTRDPKL